MLNLHMTKFQLPEIDMTYVKLIAMIIFGFELFLVFIIISTAFLLYATLLGPHFFEIAYNMHLIKTQIPDSEAIYYCLSSLLSVVLLFVTLGVAFSKDIREFFR